MANFNEISKEKISEINSRLRQQEIYSSGEDKPEDVSNTVCTITDEEELEILAHIYNQKLIDNCSIF